MRKEKAILIKQQGLKWKINSIKIYFDLINSSLKITEVSFNVWNSDGKVKLNFLDIIIFLINKIVNSPK